MAFVSVIGGAPIQVRILTGITDDAYLVELTSEPSRKIVVYYDSLTFERADELSLALESDYNNRRLADDDMRPPISNKAIFVAMIFGFSSLFIMAGLFALMIYGVRTWFL